VTGPSADANSINVNPKSDVLAKRAFITHLLLERGFDEARVTRRPADVTAIKGGQVYYFEIKYTSQVATYFGAATLSEWEAALEFEEFYRFVIAMKTDTGWTFREFTPAEFIQFSYIPPFKVFFSVPIDTKASSPIALKTKKVRMSRQRLSEMTAIYRKFRSEAS
jgi:hypothetical protein